MHRQASGNGPAVLPLARSRRIPPRPHGAAAPADRHCDRQSGSTASAAARACVGRCAPAPAQPDAHRTLAASHRPRPPALATAHSTSAAQPDRNADQRQPRQNTPAPPRRERRLRDRTARSTDPWRARGVARQAWNRNNRARSNAAHRSVVLLARNAAARRATCPDALR